MEKTRGEGSKLRITSELEDKICQAYQQGFSTGKIAEAFDVSYSTVFNVLKHRSVPLSRRSGTVLFCAACRLWIPLSEAWLKLGRPMCPNCRRKLLNRTTSWTVKK